ncbi:TPA: muramoyltetrapeptide carboxypeptidase [Salmonella enterica subsp. enterica serovar Typhi str. CT18]|uniref:Muramoyltetrapeptide carboxypeptidase n=1 Tax=Salmonella enterica subsp. enterica serovar Typhi str. CT18 TaxID=220341 RepID=A0A714MV34_SALTI|nr:muramoyltetrapeptide carboxypeptidase [Salmonella enterica]HAD4244595.1 muramoyltetrapeptide carboxypeptidase [Salmonella enterica subsp. enterica serovar Typhi str. CT18]WIT20999.1 muramoyltetrapeptide carboxypeptidase [Salmonella enterica subsp. enterica serovar Typhi]WIT32410.1 muramoyltetrapeptide carboxypeptidase [Salmonella enterica subsp. enterica serovar Typhi]HAD5243501.1 muramoyltetrapeptide carboxypeptidase [Salmonella enterica subsp. enterica serovar Typhi str. CT18]HAD6035582.1
MSLFHLIAPSGYCINQQAALRGVQRLTDAGHQVENDEVIRRRYQRFAGTDAERLADVNSLASLTSPDTIVMPVRGGYGASRLLDRIDWQALASRQQRDPLLICGHSDFTAIQAGLLAQANVITFSGPMLAANFGAETLNTFTEQHFWLALRKAQFTVEWQGDGPQCDVQGTLWGGNLAMLISLIGTPWMPTIDKGILVLEDVNEHPFRVERMLLQLEYAGILNRQSAIVLGSFSDAAPNEYDAGYSLESVYAFLRSRLSVPLITGLDFGHEQRTVTLPIGANATLKNTRQGTQLTLSGHPTLQL